MYNYVTQDNYTICGNAYNLEYKALTPSMLPLPYTVQHSSIIKKIVFLWILLMMIMIMVLY